MVSERPEKHICLTIATGLKWGTRAGEHELQLLPKVSKKRVSLPIVSSKQWNPSLEMPAAIFDMIEKPKQQKADMEDGKNTFLAT